MAPKSDYLIPGEAVVLCTHRHLLTLAGPVLFNLAALLLLSWAAYAFGEYRLLWLLIPPLVYLLWRILIRTRKLYMITNLRVIRHEGLIAVSALDASLDKINNVFYEQSLAGRILGYGNVGLETASEKGTIVFHLIPDPQGFKNSVLKQRELYKPLHAGERNQAAPLGIPRLLEDLASLRDRSIITEEEFQEKKKKLLGSL
jgi:uncharacterized membrane protein YdbT with pleckstrin-like domain